MSSANSNVPTKDVTNLNMAEAQDGVLRTSLGDAAYLDLMVTKEKHEDVDPSFSPMDATNYDKIIVREIFEGNGNSDSKVKTTDKAVIEIDDEEEAVIELNVGHGNQVAEKKGSVEKKI